MTGFLFFLSLLAFTVLIVHQRYHLFKENRDKEIYSILRETENNIEQTLRSYYTVSLTMTFTVGKDGVPQNFEAIADKMLRSNRSIRCIELVPDGVIRYIYPLAGNEAALNKDLFKTTHINAVETERAKKTKSIYYQGPVELFQGGNGMIGRIPIFIGDKLWGFSAVVVNLEEFFKISGIDNTKYKDFRFQFSKVNPVTHKEEFFLPLENPHNSYQSKSVNLRDGDWNLSVYYINRWEVWTQLISTILFGLSMAGLSGYLLTRLIIKQYDLQQMFQQQGIMLNNTETKYKGIFDHAAIGIARVNSTTGVLLEVNKYLADFLEFEPEELVNKKIKTLIHPDDLEKDSREFKLFLAGDIKQIDDEKRYINKRGEVKWGNVTITPLWQEGKEPDCHIIILEDSTIKKEAEKVISESQHRIESLINTIDGIVWETHADTHKSIFISKKVEDILGYTVEEWQSRPSFWYDHVYPDDRERVINYLHENINRLKQMDSEYRMFAGNGSVVWIRDIVTVVEENGKPAKLRGIMIDVSLQKQAETVLNKSFTLVSEQNKRLLNFSYIVSHNLRSHAGNIQGITALIENAQSESERRDMVHLLKTVVDNLNETLMNLNNVVNIQNSMDIEIEPLNLREYVRRTIETLKVHILDKKAVIINEVADHISIKHNRAYLESILLNLISNAIRYGHPQRDPVIVLTSVERNEMVIFRIADNGIGIDLQKNGDKMFGMYQTFHGNPDAKGYGLFITKNQVEALGGKIEVQSILNEGTTFKIYFA